MNEEMKELETEKPEHACRRHPIDCPICHPEMHKHCRGEERK